MAKETDRAGKFSAVVAGAVLLIAGAFVSSPMGAQAQGKPPTQDETKTPNTPLPPPTKAAAARVVQMIQADKAKLKIYCDLDAIGEKIEQAYEKKDEAAVNALSEKMDELGANLGPEYIALMEGLQDLEPNSSIATEIGDVFGPLDDMCGTK